MAVPSQRSPWVLVTALGIAQIISWGSIYYAFALLIDPLSAALHVPTSAVVGAFSAALLATGLASAPVGWLIDRFGGRWVMTTGSLAGAALLAVMPQVQNLVQLYAVWIGLGLVLAATLYDPAFAVLTQVFREGQRRAITALTLFGGFASTVFWPLTQWLVADWGWTSAVLALAGFNLLVCAPLHAIFIPAHHQPVAQAGSQPGSRLGAALRDPLFYGIAAAFTVNALVFSAMAVHMLGLLHHKGLSLSQAAWIGALVGPMQVLGRVLEHVFLRQWPAARVGVVAIWMLPASLALLLAPGGQVAWFIGFALLYGMSNGVMTIVRGALPREIYGAASFGAVNGALATPVLAARAAGPIAAALALAAMSETFVLAMLCALAVASAALFTRLLAPAAAARAAAKRE